MTFWTLCTMAWTITCYCFQNGK
uniref:Uncharacterized protein n=1 Tax=Rhizophora mucronata TaxID=61149 RepID=A0A2P2QNI0_RHIMU